MGLVGLDVCKYRHICTHRQDILQVTTNIKALTRPFRVKPLTRLLRVKALRAHHDVEALTTHHYVLQVTTKVLPLFDQFPLAITKPIMSKLG